MPTKTWKHCELEIAKFFIGSERRGADFRDKFNGGGKSDLIFPGWSIEIKHSRRPTIGLMEGAIDQAITNREDPNDISVAVIHRAGSEYKNSLVIMRLEDFVDHFVNLPVDKAV